MDRVEHAFEWAALTVEAIGVLVILVGIVAAGFDFARHRTIERTRSAIGRAILLGLEFLVAADIIATVSADATLRDVVILAIVVGIRTFLSLTIELEISGRWPWQRIRGDER
jgi:uncharacterized membrane protein